MWICNVFHFVLQVLIPSKVYNGQNETRLVSAKTAATTTKTIPRVPDITPEKYKAAKTTANTILIIRSIEPMFAFIIIII